MQSALATHLSQQEQGLQGLMDHFLLPITNRAASGPMPTAAPAAGPSPAGGIPTLFLSDALLSPFSLQPPPLPHEPRLHHSMSAANNNSERLRLAVAELVGDVEDDQQLENTLTAARYHRYGRACKAHGYGGWTTTMHVWVHGRGLNRQCMMPRSVNVV